MLVVEQICMSMLYGLMSWDIKLASLLIMINHKNLNLKKMNVKKKE